MKLFRLSLTAFLICSPVSFAHAEWVRYQNMKVALEVPKQWQIVKDLYGVPITVMGPERDGERAIFVVQPTPLRNFKINFPDIQASQKNYFDGRKAWLAQWEDSHFISSIPYRKLPEQKGLEGFELGFRYQLRGHQFEERSVQLTCGDRFYLLKSLASEKNTNEDKQTLARLMERFECASVSETDGNEVAGPLHQIQDFLHEDQARTWPGVQDWRNSNLDQKAEALEAVVQFYKSYEAADNDETEYSAVEGASSAFASFRSTLFALLPGANAQEGYNCFFGGWPSRYITHSRSKTVCDYPQNQNSSYPKNACSPGQMACNEALFGKNLCVDISKSGFRNHATLACEEEFKSSGQDYREVVKSATFNSGLLEQTIESAREVCTREDYFSTHQGLCFTLQQKLNQSIASGNSAAPETPAPFIENLEEVPKQELENALSALNTEWISFEKECFDENRKIKKTSECSERAELIRADMERIEKTGKKAEEAISGGADSIGRDCHSANCNASQEITDEAEDGVPDAGGGCTQDQEKSKIAGVCKWTTDWILNQSGSCVKNAFLSMVKNLWASVKGITNLAWTGLVAGKNLLMDLFTAEDEMANKAHQASQTNDSFLKKLQSDPMKVLATLAQVIADSVTEFAQKDLLCQSWSGAPHFSECLAPANFSCSSCTTQVRATCSLFGYAMGEVLPAILTGGTVSLAKNGALGVKMGSLMSKASRSGKLLKFVGEIERKIPGLPKLNITKRVGSTAKAEFGVKSAQKISALRPGLSAIKTFMGKFPSKIFGSFGEALRYLKNLKPVKWAGETRAGKIGIGAVKGTASITKSVLTLPLAPYRYAYQLGLKAGEKIANTAFVKAAKMEAAASLATKTGGAVASSEIIFPEATRFVEKTAQHEKQLKFFEAFKFDSGKRQEAAAKVIAAQKELISEVQLAHLGSTGLEQFNRTKAASEKLKLLNQNNQKLVNLIRQEDKAFMIEKMPASGLTLKMRALIAGTAAKQPDYLVRKNDEVETIIDYQMTEAQIAAKAKKLKISSVQLKTKLQQEKENYEIQVDIRNKMMNDQTLTAEDKARLKKTKMRVEEMEKVVSESMRNILINRLEAGQAFTPEDEIHLKKYFKVDGEQFKAQYLQYLESVQSQ